MSLGPDNTICKKEFTDAMRARLEADKPGSGSNVDLPDVQKNFGALGQAIYNIATRDADTTSNANIDPAFWKWVAALDAWQKGVAQAFTNWQPTQPDGQALKTAILTVPTPQSTSAPAPTTVKGKII